MTVKHFPPSPKTTLPGKLETKVVGCSFVPGPLAYPDNLLWLHTLQARAETPPVLVLAHDKANTHDPNAVAVRSATGRHLGHLPAALAARIAPEVERWAVESYEVLIAPGHEDHPGLSLSLRRSEP